MTDEMKKTSLTSFFRNRSVEEVYKVVRDRSPEEIVRISVFFRNLCVFRYRSGEEVYKEVRYRSPEGIVRICVFFRNQSGKEVYKVVRDRVRRKNYCVSYFRNRSGEEVYKVVRDGVRWRNCANRFVSTPRHVGGRSPIRKTNSPAGLVGKDCLFCLHPYRT